MIISTSYGAIIRTYQGVIAGSRPAGPFSPEPIYDVLVLTTGSVNRINALGAHYSLECEGEYSLCLVRSDRALRFGK